MNRRDAILVPLACGAAGLPFFASAQAPKPGPARRIGYLANHAEPAIPLAQRDLVVQLNKLGWVIGENLILERVYADGHVDRLPALAQELIRRKVELIMAPIAVAALAAGRATQTIPIVFWNVDWPLEQGFIDSFARPGRNLTGSAYWPSVETAFKRLEILREIVPTAKRLSFLLDAVAGETLSGGQVGLESVRQRVASDLGFEVRLHMLSGPQDVAKALGQIAAWSAQALSVVGPTAGGSGQSIADFALRQRLPTAAAFRSIVDQGALLSYAAPRSELTRLFRRSIGYVDRILRGEKPADLPVEMPSRFELAINMKTAKALGLTIPQSVLLRADELIQ